MSAYYRLIKREPSPELSVAYYEPNIHAQGAWNPHEQHMAPATGVLCAELELFNPQPHLRYSRINLDIWGLISLKPFSIEVRSLRPGRTIELVEARMIAEGKTCIVAKAWRTVTSDTRAVAALEDPSIPSYSECDPWLGMKQWGGGFIDSMNFRQHSERRNGKGIVWLSNELDMVEGQTTSDFVRIMGMCDTSNGIVARENPRQWMFPNVDLNLNLLRMPQGRWLGLSTVQQYGSDGIGLTSSVLYDELGMFGRSEQTLTLREMKS